MRKEAFHTYYTQYDAHKNTLAAALNGSVQRDVYYAKARGLQERAGGGAVRRQRADVGLRQPDRLRPRATCRRCYRYYDLRRRTMKLKDIHQYDTYVPILSDAGEAAHVGPGGEGGDRRRSSRWATSTAASCSAG